MALSNKLGNFLPHELSVIIGSLSIAGWADGVFLNITQVNDNINDLEGAGGEVGVVLNRSALFQAEINLLQTAEENTSISLLHKASITTGIVYPFFVKDSLGQTIGSAGATYFTKFADAGFNKDGVETRTWTLKLPHFEYILGGNAR